MGCGGSIYAEDGSPLPGKGKADVVLDDPIPVLFYSGIESAVQLKQLPVPTKSKDEQKNCGKYLSDGCTPGAAPGASWAGVLADTPYEQRYIAKGGYVFKYTNGTVSDVCRRLGAVHAKDGEKLLKVAKKSNEKEKDHPYTTPEADNLCKEDLTHLEKVKVASELPERLGKFKELVKGVEDNIPQNHFTVSADCAREPGFWDEGEGGKFDRVLALPEKAELAALGKLMVPEMLMKKQIMQSKAMQKAGSGALMGVCKGLGIEVADVAPDSDDAFAELVDIRNGFEPLAEPKAGEPAPEVSPEDAEKARLEEVKKQLEADKPKLAQWKTEDAVPLDARKAALEARVIASHAALAALPAGGAGEYFNCRSKGKGGVYEAKKSGSSYTWAPSKLDAGSSESLQDTGKAKVTNPLTGAVEEKDVANVVALGPVVPFADLRLGDHVRIRVGDAFHSGAVTFNDGTSITVRDFSNEYFKPEASCVWRDTGVTALVSRPHVLLPHAPMVSFWWIAAEDDAVGARAVRVWREEAEADTLVTVNLEKQYKTNDAGVKIFKGYRAQVPILPRRSYCFNFKIGEKTMVDWEKPAKSEKAFKRFRLQLGS